MLERLRGYPPTVLTLFAGGAVVALSVASNFVPLFGFLLNYFSALPLFLVSFSLAAQAGIIAATIAIAGFILLSGVFQAVGFLVITYLPFILLSYFFLKKNPEHKNFYYPVGIGLSRANACLLSGLVLLLLGLDLYGINVHESLQHFLEKILPENFLKTQPHVIHQLIDIFPAILTISWLSTSLMNAFVAYRLLEKRNLLLRVVNASKDLNFELYWDIIVTVGLMLIIAHHYIDSQLLSILGKTITLIGCMPLAILGFRVCYLAFQGTEAKKFWFTTIIIMSFLLVWPLLIIVMLGFIEPWYGLIQRFAEKSAE